MKPLYISKHWKYYNNKRFHIEGVSRKTKKHLQKAIKAGYMPTAAEQRWFQMEDCKWCYGGGHIRDHEFDSGYTCPDCRGRGKNKWFVKTGKMYSTETGLEVSDSW
ncbi:hypothetical protein [Paenibacillus odorifer]|uniref:hypothetical protein n=1 Tax=Paenibacillus odorifer TaxID=189426 RepID=UPI00096FD995|nr:hypothetical protein [Paenibacillus odorifer]OMD76860.1 hypothetical protein BSK50_13995 [Paenibacillus odorifer]